MWRIRDGRLQAGYPALSSRHWRGFPEYIDAAYEDKSGNTWFFQGTKLNPTQPQPLTNPNQTVLFSEYLFSTSCFLFVTADSLVSTSCFLFVTADSYWVFDGERKLSGPDPVQSLGLPVTDIHAALRWDVDHVEKAFLFKSSFYWTFMVQENRVSDPHPHSLHELVGLPSSIDAAFLDRSGEDLNQIYF